MTGPMGSYMVVTCILYNCNLWMMSIRDCALYHSHRYIVLCWFAVDVILPLENKPIYYYYYYYYYYVCTSIELVNEV